MYRTQAERLRLSADARIGPQVSLAASFEERVAELLHRIGAAIRVPMMDNLQ
jgi:hypothetical protein